jgi:hydroxyacylglutathione hydrolase
MPPAASTLIVHTFPCLKDNYGFLVHDPASGQTACVDTPDPDAILAEAQRLNWTITAICNTHWHPDHAGGNARLKAATGATIFAPAAEAARIPALDHAIAGGDRLTLGSHTVNVIDTGGHTLGHVSFHIPAAGLAFVGDTLFALGCGRLFEGTPAQMWESLKRLRALPPETIIHCAHEYTASNARFALSVDPANPALQAYAAEVAARRAQSLPTVPTILSRELAANPFLRADDPSLQATMGTPGDPVATFAEIRTRKDRF